MLRQELEQTGENLWASLDHQALGKKIKKSWKELKEERFVCRANNWWEVYRY
jgi:uncharacterized NAD(P)/FAD-binding protein YdhS